MKKKELYIPCGIVKTHQHENYSWVIIKSVLYKEMIIHEALLPNSRFFNIDGNGQKFVKAEIEKAEEPFFKGYVKIFLSENYYPDFLICEKEFVELIKKK